MMFAHLLHNRCLGGPGFAGHGPRTDQIGSKLWQERLYLIIEAVTIFWSGRKIRPKVGKCAFVIIHAATVQP
jgi:hypothetical protein